MQITRNTTSMAAGLSIATDKNGRDSCVIVVKGTFSVDSSGSTRLADDQVPLAYTDEHYGDPSTTSMRYECDFSPFKPRCDVLLNGAAYAPGGRPAKRVTVGLRVGSVNKSFEVVGDRVWRRRLWWTVPTRPAPFTRLPITYDLAFGGVDGSSRRPEQVRTYAENPVGRGYYPLTKRGSLIGKHLQNIEPVGLRIRKFSREIPPISFGPMSRNFSARIRYAGTYDEQWKKERFPFLPDDFDDRYFQAAPVDQQSPFLKGGEAVSCTNLTPEGHFAFAVPRVRVPVVCKFADRQARPAANLDTLIIEPDERRCILVWRASVPLGRKLHALRQVLVGHPLRSRSSKPHFRSIRELVEWKRQRGLR